jgi:glycosyltransferase involved in cell wall biosynthesis
VSRTLQKHYLAQHSKETVYTPNGTQLRKRRRGSYLEKLGLVPSGYVLYLGRFSPEKNCDLLIDAFEEAPTPLKLVLAGGSSHTDRYVARLRQHESDRIQFLDWLSGDAFEEVLTNAALFVLPSDIEGLSLALLDAMGAGVCVLASDVPENREVIEDTGFVFKRGDGPDLQRMLSLLLSDARLREMAGGSAQQRVRQHYLWGKVAKEIAAVYEGVMSPPKKKPGWAMSSEGRAA